MESLLKKIEEVETHLNRIAREIAIIVERVEGFKELAMDADLKAADDDDRLIDDFCFQHSGIIKDDAEFDTDLTSTSTSTGIEIEVECSISNESDLLEDVARKFLEFMRKEGKQ
jgi:hypothetical protein